MGFPHPDYLLRFLSYPQLREWMIYYSIEPFGQYPEYLRAGIIASVIANVHRGKRGRTFKPEDFIPKDPEDSKPKVQSIEEQKQALKSICAWAKKRKLTKADTVSDGPKKKSVKKKLNKRKPNG